MKKLLIILITTFILLISENVYAMDSVYSLNKNKDERFKNIINSYNTKHEIDGVIAAGNFCDEKEDKEEKTKIEDYQIMIVKYNKDGKVKWNYTYGNTSNDELDYITYSYDEESNIDGYIIVLKNTYDINQQQEEKESLSTIIKIGLDGKKVWEKNSNINKKETMKKVIPTYNEEKKVDGYIAIATTTNNSAIIVKYDKEFNIVWDKEYKNQDYEKTTYEDVENIYEEGKVVGYVVVRKQENKIQNKNKQTELIRFDKDGNEVKNIDNTINKYDSVNLQSSNNGFIIYGKTSDLKLKKGSTSFYIIKYSSLDTEEWETIGDVILDDDGKVVVNPIIVEDEIKGYHLLCTNKKDASTYVIRIDADGIIKKKIKKITNEYYDMEDFLIHNDVIYFVGQIICPEDDNCEYDTNSLFLVSDEDKVIEVKDNQSANVLIFIGAFAVGCFGISFMRKRKKMN